MKFLTVCREYIGRSSFERFYRNVLKLGVTRKNIVKVGFAMGYNSVTLNAMADRMNLPQ